MTLDRFTLELGPGRCGLLRDVVNKQQPKLLALVDEGRLLTRADIEKLMLAVTLEFASAGLRDDHEPTEYGIELERLTDDLNRHGFM